MGNIKKRGVGHPEKTKRNREIYQKKMAGATYRELLKKYNLSFTSLQKIINRWKRRENP
jgi:Mor family transcriptional regulator